MAVKTHQDYAGLIERVSRFREENPSGYKLRLILLTALGFSVPVLVVLVGLLLGAGFVFLIVSGKALLLIKVGLKLIWVPALVGYVLVRALLVRGTPPTGREITQSEAPELFAAIEHAREVGDSKPAHHVILVDELNASVSEIPAWGLIGPTKRYLSIGVPLMAALTPEQFDSVLGHEFGHLSRGDARFGNFIYRLRLSWNGLLERLELESGFAIKGFQAFYRWFSPYYSAYSFVLAQANEYDADQNGAKATSARTAADALTMISIQADRYGTYWSKLYERTSTQDQPPQDGIPGAYQILRQPFAPEAVQASLQKTLGLETTHHDTHPSLSDRLKGLNQEARLPELSGPSAAEAYLGPLFQEYVTEESKLWLANVTPVWKQQFDHASNAQGRLRELAALEEKGALDDDQTFEYAELIEHFEGAEAAYVRYDAILKQTPDHLSAKFACGRILLSQGKTEGESYLRSLVEGDSPHEAPAAILYQHYIANNDHKGADEMAAILQRLSAQEEQETAEVTEVTKKTVLIAADLSEEAIQRFVDVAEAAGKIKKLWVAQKFFDDPNQSCLVIVVSFKTFFDSSGAKQREMLQQLVDARPDSFSGVVFNEKDNEWLRRKINKVPGSQIFPLK